jgi:hypothetical protein
MGNLRWARLDAWMGFCMTSVYIWMHARTSSCLIVLTLQCPLPVGQSPAVLLLVFWAGVLLVRTCLSFVGL